jgi:hypothetical protein
MRIDDKKALFIDYGYSTYLCDRIAREYGKVWYYRPDWKSFFPTGDKQITGTGFKNFECIYDVHKYIPKADIIIFPALYDADWQEALVNEGHLVFGSRWSQWTEIDKWLFYNLLMSETGKADQDILKKYGLNKFKLNLPVAETIRLIGFDNLEEMLQELKGEWYLKTTTRKRGDIETRKFVGFKKFRTILRELAYNTEYQADTTEYLLTKKINSKCESGYDEYQIDGQSSPYLTIGNEAKDEGYVCKVVKLEELPSILNKVREAMAPVYEFLGQRGKHSTEIRITTNGDPYFIDDTQREPSPPGELWSELFTFPGEDIWDVASGKLPKMKHEKKYAAQIMLHSDWLVKNWVPVSYPKGISQFVKLRNNCFIGKDEYCLPFDEEKTLGAIIGLGDTKEEAIEECKSNVEEFWGEQVHYKIEAFDEILEAIKCGTQFGITL